MNIGIDKDCFVHDGTYSDSKDVTERSTSEKILKDIA